MTESLARQNISIESIEEEYCHAVFAIEKELGHYIDDEYPVTKFLEGINQLKFFKEKEKEQMDGID